MEMGPCVVLFAVLTTVFAQSSCPPGSFRDIHTDQCKICPATTYTDQPNNNSQCKRCHMCTGGQFEILHPCLATANTVCGCKQGFMCTRSDCKSCKPQRKCKKGQEVTQKGNSFKETQCKDCENDMYSDTEDGVCKPWTDCSAKGLQVVRNGSRTEDVTCGSFPTVATTSQGRGKYRTLIPSDHPRNKDNKNDGIVAIIAIILLPCVFIPFMLFMMAQSKRKQDPDQLVVKNIEDFPLTFTVPKDIDVCSCHSPEEETGDWQLRQETTPKPPE
ncbi:tumor necrosis factor receptor superfamily member 9-like [Hypanus sabinus]|uniref:tumor necrosis factor receptor superfamily member 9-like n=1 Tax=Hypanus sabinus TaxID=79690 RepID=UPI0028C3F309|nr:tumor necrosis factor receptor superfamily member 9-like [Hypanus sabinus]